MATRKPIPAEYQIHDSRFFDLIIPGAELRHLHDGGASGRDVARTLMEEFGLPRNEAYRLAADGRGDISGSGSETA